MVMFQKKKKWWRQWFFFFEFLDQLIDQLSDYDIKGVLGDFVTPITIK